MEKFFEIMIKYISFKYKLRTEYLILKTELELQLKTALHNLKKQHGSNW